MQAQFGSRYRAGSRDPAKSDPLRRISGVVPRERSSRPDRDESLFVFRGLGRKGDTMRLNGARMVCESLMAEGVQVVFGIPGGAIMPLYDVLPEYPGLLHVLTRHEQGAAHMADAYGRASCDVGVC